MIEPVIFQDYVIRGLQHQQVYKKNFVSSMDIEAILRLNRIVVSIEWTKDGYFIKSIHSDLDYKTRKNISYRRAYL